MSAYLNATDLHVAPPRVQLISAALRLLFFFCLKRLSRHYLPPVADYGEKDESEVRKSRTVQNV